MMALDIQSLLLPFQQYRKFIRRVLELGIQPPWRSGPVPQAELISGACCLISEAKSLRKVNQVYFIELGPIALCVSLETKIVECGPCWVFASNVTLPSPPKKVGSDWRDLAG